MRLRNRITKAAFWTDGTLLRWPRDKRYFCKSLWAMAEDSCCIVDDPFDWKCTAWPSPVDADDLTVEKFELWRDELIEAGKLVPYEVEGKRYLYLPGMAKYEKPRNPQSPDLPLPPWVRWVPHETDTRKGSYEHSSYNGCTTLPALPCSALPCPDLSGTEQSGP